jgi:hypothetical protein
MLGKCWKTGVVHNNSIHMGTWGNFGGSYPLVNSNPKRRNVVCYKETGWEETSSQPVYFALNSVLAARPDSLSFAGGAMLLLPGHFGNGFVKVNE